MGERQVDIYKGVGVRDPDFGEVVRTKGSDRRCRGKPGRSRGTIDR
jgi:hypothetical protein